MQENERTRFKILVVDVYGSNEYDDKKEGGSAMIDWVDWIE